MPDKAWKAWERRVATYFGGRRRGADTRGNDSGKSDVVCETYAPECKLLGRPSFSDLQAACRQAERNADGLIPVAVVKKLHQGDEIALVVMHLGAFREHFLGEHE